MAKNMVSGIISLTISVIVLTNVFLQVVKDTNTSEFTGAETALFGILGLAGILGLVVGIFQVFNLI